MKMDKQSKVYYITFGCKVNLCETENLRREFTAAGCPPAGREEDADIFAVNSCTVTGTSDKKLRQELNRLRRSYPNTCIALTGCFPQAFPEEARALPADVVRGSKNRRELVEAVLRFLTEHRPSFQVEKYQTGDLFESFPLPSDSECLESSPKTRAFLKIQDGCNQFCTYCIIPKARGRIRSMPLDQVREQSRALARAGHREIVLVGINLGFYGAESGLRLADACEAAASVPEVHRVRLGSLEPERLTQEDVERLSRIPGLCPHFHLSLQSGCEKTLRAMGRKYTPEDYAGLVKHLRDAFPDCAVTTDLIAGFPGESAEDFAQSAAFCQSISFAKAHIFPYSRREGTPAAALPDQIREDEKTRRVKQLSEICAQSRREFLKAHMGKETSVLMERERSPEFHQGLAPDGTLIKIPSKNGEKSLRGGLFCVRIDAIAEDCCTGRILHPVE